MLAQGLAVGVSDKIPTVLLIHTVKSGKSFGSDRGCYLKSASGVVNWISK